MSRTLTLKLVPVLLAFVFVSDAKAAGHEVRPNLYVLAIGVGQFQHADRYPDLLSGVSATPKDARDIAREFEKQQGKLYQRVEIITLTNSQATKANILHALESLKKVVRAGDTVVVFMAGHGSVDGGQYFCTVYDYDRANPSTRFEWTSFMNVLRDLPGTRMLILDTCFSGAAVGNTPITSSQELFQAGSRSGVIVYAACTSQQVSLQERAGGNGVFTHALVDALSGKADLNNDGVVTLAEVDAYVDNRVRAETQGQQHPTMQRPASISSSYTMARLHSNSQPVLVTHLPPMPYVSSSQTGLNVQPVQYVFSDSPKINSIKLR